MAAKKKTTKKSVTTYVPVRTQVLIATGVVLLLVVFGLVVAILDGSLAKRQTSSVASHVFPDVTLKGESVCLPHRDTTGPQTQECAIGLKTKSGVYYGLEGYSAWDTAKQLTLTGDLVSATGNENYNIVGTLRAD